MSGVRTHKLDLAFETKTYFRKDFISRDQLLDAFGIIELLKSMSDQIEKHRLQEYITAYPRDLSKLDLTEENKVEFTHRCERIKAFRHFESLPPKGEEYCNQSSSVDYWMPRIEIIKAIIFNRDKTIVKNDFSEKNVWKIMISLSKRLNPDFDKSLSGIPIEQRSEYTYGGWTGWICKSPQRDTLSDFLKVLPIVWPLLISSKLSGDTHSGYICPTDNNYYYKLADVFVPADERK
jgi:hypothetical protein